MPLRRTLLAECFALVLAMLAASPFTAPFMTCDLSGSHAAVDLAHKKHLPHNDPLVLPAAVTTAMESLDVFEVGSAGSAAFLPRRLALHAILRV